MCVCVSKQLYDDFFFFPPLIRASRPAEAARPLVLELTKGPHSSYSSHKSLGVDTVSAFNLEDLFVKRNVYGLKIFFPLILFIRNCSLNFTSPGYIIHIYRHINIYIDRFYALWVNCDKWLEFLWM